MKRLFILIAVVMTTAGAMGQDAVIPTNILGVKLGYSTKTEVDKVLSSQGFENISDASDTINYPYKGDCQHEGMKFHGIVTRYMQDTLVFLGFYAHCDSACTDYGKAFIERIHSRFNHLPNADTTLYGKLLTIDAQDMETWTRKDDKSLIVTMRNDTLCTCIYFANERMKEIMVNSLVAMYKDFSPDYAKENKVTGVAGVKFGDSREVVKRVMASKNCRLIDSDDYSILYVDASIGGVTYDFAKFFFKSGEGLVSVNLQSAFRDWRKEEAGMFLESIVRQYSRKYSNIQQLKDDKDAKLYKCGAYIDGYDYPPIFISFSKSLSRGGSIMYYVQVDYYEMRRKSLYDDEI